MAETKKITYTTEEEYTPYIDTIPNTPKIKQEITGKTGELNWRCNNPGNIRPSKNTDSYAIGIENSKESGKFAVFATPVDGMMAMYDILGRYWNDGKNTVKSIISKYAPKEDNNNTEKYINDVCSELGVKPDDILPDLSNNKDVAIKLAKAMVRSEGSKSFDYWEKEVPGIYEKAWSKYKNTPLNYSENKNSKNMANKEKTEEDPRITAQRNYVISSDPQQEDITRYYSSEKINYDQTTVDDYNARKNSGVKNGEYYTRDLFDSAQNDYLNRVDKKMFDNMLDENKMNYYQKLINSNEISSHNRKAREQINEINKALDNLKSNNGLEFTDPTLSEYAKLYAKRYWNETMGRVVIRDDRRTMGLTEMLGAELTGKINATIDDIVNGDIWRKSDEKFKQEVVYNIMKRMRNQALEMDDESFYNTYKFNKDDLINTRYDVEKLANVTDISPDALTSLDRVNWARLNFVFKDAVAGQHDRLYVNPNLIYDRFPDPKVSSSAQGKVQVQGSAGDGTTQSTQKEDGKRNIDLKENFDPYVKERNLISYDENPSIYWGSYKDFAEVYKNVIDALKDNPEDKKFNDEKVKKYNAEGLVQAINYWEDQKKYGKISDDNIDALKRAAFADWFVNNYTNDNNLSYTYLYNGEKINSNPQNWSDNFILHNGKYLNKYKSGYKSAYDYAIAYLLGSDDSFVNQQSSANRIYKTPIDDNEQSFILMLNSNKANNNSNRLFHIQMLDGGNQSKITEINSKMLNDPNIKKYLLQEKLKNYSQYWSNINSGKLIQ